MIKSKCQICSQELEAGCQEITKEDLNFEMKGINLLKEDFGLPAGEEARQKLERKEWLISIGAKEQVQYWAHDPRNLHCDILVTVHRDCFEKIKKVYPDFDKPVQDYDICKYPTIDKTEKIILKTPTDFIK